MQQAFGIVIFAVVGLAAVGALLSLVGRGRLYEQIGRGGLSLNEEGEQRREPGPGSTASRLERDEEIRQLLGARNQRRQRRGQAPLDIEAELTRLTATTVDHELVGEVRQLVVARNERRARAGKPPLDVEHEVARQLRDLGA